MNEYYIFNRLLFSRISQQKKAKQMPIYTIYNSGFICSDHIVVIYIFLFDIVTYKKKD